MNNNLVHIAGLTKNYGTFTAIDNMNLTLPAGRVIGLLGPNGSGKTTLIKLLAGLLTQYQGSIAINGRVPGIETKKIVSYLPDRNYLIDKWSASDAINYFKDFFGDFNAEKARNLMDAMYVDVHKRFKTLSKGTKEKVQLALTLSRDAKLYLFDEPIAGVDPAARDFIFKLILENYNKDASVIISTHLISEVEHILDFAVFLGRGKITLAGDVREIVNYHQKSLNDLFREIFRYVF